MHTITHEVIMIIEECANCRMLFGITRDFKDSLLTKGGSFYCPQGHGLNYGKSENDKLKSWLEQERNNTQWWKEEAESKARSLSATKGVLTRTKKRLSGGACPCCNRQFVNLARHMNTKHPEYVTEEV